jgi:hypothetical protein
MKSKVLDDTRHDYKWLVEQRMELCCFSINIGSHSCIQMDDARNYCSSGETFINCCVQQHGRFGTANVVAWFGIMSSIYNKDDMF